MTKQSTGWFKVLYIIMAILFVIAGFTFMMYPALESLYLGMFIGCMAIAYGVVMVIAYFMATQFKSIWALIMGIVLIVLGFIMTSHPAKTSQIFGVVLGIGLLISGAYKTYHSFELKNFGWSYWWLSLISGICSLIIGCVICFNIGDAGAYLAIWIGADFVVTGINDLVLAFTVL